MNEIFLYIIDMIESELNKLLKIKATCNYNDTIHNVLTVVIVKYMRDKKIKSLIE